VSACAAPAPRNSIAGVATAAITATIADVTIFGMDGVVFIAPSFP
jgi:hypothetical protein